MIVFAHMAKLSTPTVETTKDFILIKIPQKLFGKETTHKNLSQLEQGIQESFNEARSGKLQGPFRGAKDFLHALKNL